MNELIESESTEYNNNNGQRCAHNRHTAQFPIQRRLCHAGQMQINLYDAMNLFCVLKHYFFFGIFSHSVCFAYWNFFLFFVPLIYNLAHRCDHCYCMTFGFCAFYPLIQALRNYVAWSYSKYIFSVVLIHLNLLAAHFIWNVCFTSLH